MTRRSKSPIDPARGRLLPWVIVVLVALILTAFILWRLTIDDRTQPNAVATSPVGQVS